MNLPGDQLDVGDLLQPVKFELPSTKAKEQTVELKNHSKFLMLQRDKTKVCWLE